MSVLNFTVVGGSPTDKIVIHLASDVFLCQLRDEEGGD
jgi:hypothetical protein